VVVGRPDRSGDGFSHGSKKLDCELNFWSCSTRFDSANPELPRHAALETLAAPLADGDAAPRRSTRDVEAVVRSSSAATAASDDAPGCTLVFRKAAPFTALGYPTCQQSRRCPQPTRAHG